MTPLDLVKLPPLMDRTSGSPEVTIGLIDGPVVIEPSRACRPTRPRDPWKREWCLHSGQ